MALLCSILSWYTIDNFVEDIEKSLDVCSLLLYLAASERQELYSSSLKLILIVVARRSGKTLYFTNRASHNEFEFKNFEL